MLFDYLKALHFAALTYLHLELKRPTSSLKFLLVSVYFCFNLRPNMLQVLVSTGS